MGVRRSGLTGGSGVGASAAAVLLVCLGACGPPSAEVRPSVAATVDLASVAGPPERTPVGTIEVAYPDEGASFLDVAGDDAAAADLGALWGLPLFTIDPAGQLAAGLVEHWEVVASDDGWHVELRVRPGRWSDGRDVTADDVVATVEALRTGPRAAELAPLTSVTAVDDHRVRLAFTRPYARWWALLAGVGVLPAHVLADGGTAAYEDAVPVSGGWFTVTEHIPGLRTVLTAHPEGPLGAPGVERIVVSVVPRYEAALGMLRRHDVDIVLGYLALNGVERARRVEDVVAAAPLGGTTVALRWRPDGPLGGPDAAARRRAIAAAIDVSQLVEGLLGPAGEVATSVVPGVAGPAAPGDSTDPVGSPEIVVPRWPEAVAFTARALQRDLRSVGGGMQLVSEATPVVVPLARTSGDGALIVRRTGPAPSFLGTLHDPDLARAADAGGPGSAAFAEAVTAAARDALVHPLYRVGVVHAWSPRIEGIRPSAWTGLAFWDAGAWTVAPDGR